MKIGVISISIGNVGSVVEAFNFLRQDAKPVSDPDGLSEYDLLVLAGVGNFSTAMTKLNETGIADSLKQQVSSGKPLLGICLGMQLFADQGMEDGVTEGFSWIAGKVLEIKDSNEKIPHMGWNCVTPSKGKLFEGVDKRAFYFMHSYHLDASEPNSILATVDYGENRLVAAVQKENIYGVQFHPEKSQSDGLIFLKNLLEAIR